MVMVMVDADLTITQVSLQDVHWRAGIHGTGCGAASELEACWQWGTISTGKGYCLTRRGFCSPFHMHSFAQAVNDVLPVMAFVHLLMHVACGRSFVNVLQSSVNLLYEKPE